MKKHLLNLAAIVAGVTVISSCSNSPYEGFDQAESGYYYQFHNQDKAATPAKAGDVVAVILTYKNDKDSVLFDSRKIQAEPSGAIEFPLDKATFKGSFEEALTTMAVGDSASFKVNADSVYLKTFRQASLPPYVTAGTMLTFDVKMLRIKTKEQAEVEKQKAMEKMKQMMEENKAKEPALITEFISANKITAKPSASGIYYIEHSKGTGIAPVAGDTVTVNYSGKFTNGDVFDSSMDGRHPAIDFVLGRGMVIPGWDEGVGMMKTGGKATLIIPSALAYGEYGSQGTIPPYTPLIFEVELLKVKPGKK